MGIKRPCERPNTIVSRCIHGHRWRLTVRCGKRWISDCHGCAEMRAKKIRKIVSLGGGVAGYSYYFVTLTMPGRAAKMRDWYGVTPARRAFKRWRTWFVNHFRRDLGHPDSNYFWVMEPQERGAIHYHVVVRTTAKLELHKVYAWDRKKQKYLPHWRYQVLSDICEDMGFGPFCDWELTRAKEAVTAYMGKYLGKTMGDKLRGLISEFLDSPAKCVCGTGRSGVTCKECQPKSVRTFGRTVAWCIKAVSWTGASLMWDKLSFVEGSAHLDLRDGKTGCCGMASQATPTISLLFDRARMWYARYVETPWRIPAGVNGFLNWYARKVDNGELATS